MAATLALEEIYDAVFDDEAFDELLQRLARAVGARSVVAGWHYKDASASLLRHSGYWSDDQVAEYERDFAFIDPWNVAQLRQWRPNRASDLEELVSPAEVEKSSLYNDFFRRIGDDTFRLLSIPTENRWGKGAIALHRGKSSRSFDPEAVAFLNQHASHLARLLSLRGKLSALEQRASSIEAICETLGQFMFLVARDGRLLHANPAADAMLRRGEFVCIRQGRLRARGSGDQMLAAAISAALDPVSPEARAVALVGSEGSTIHLSVIGTGASGERRNVLITGNDPDRRDDTVEGRLHALYGLSPAEARVATMLGSGMSPREIAEQRGVAMSTLRAQIKSILAKLGCNRQADVVRVVSMLPPLNGSAAPAGRA